MDKSKVKKLISSKVKRKSQNVRKKRKSVVSIGDKKLVSVRYINRTPHINIRAYNKDKHGRMFSTKRGIMLSIEEWKQLKNQFADIDKVADETNEDGC